MCAGDLSQTREQLAEEFDKAAAARAARLVSVLADQWASTFEHHDIVTTKS